ncbi:heme NO-binding protein [Gemmobacter lutimaris]|uniref:Heme NO-binding protein n=1 Tax=Gemmobacter lutimaris TaxID=2306023 RepID=A0A398BM90_9RHOB|nr:heme NO-binding domain-containing protein [Gemmobacter lutimaris]RID91819.1 heme NO-binding protein [Gemmobacter lutimaris]
MHGLINRAIQCFLRDTYGAPVWATVAQEAEPGLEGFEPMLVYDPDLTDRVIDAAARLLARPRDSVLEDLGIYLVSHPNVQALRRLLRFGGVTFVDFLQSLEELPGRARLAVPDIDLPVLELQDHSATEFTLTCRSPIRGAGHVVVGLLRAMADDYGALCLVDHGGCAGDCERIEITLAKTGFSAGRQFDLARVMPGGA